MERKSLQDVNVRRLAPGDPVLTTLNVVARFSA
jgi:hypothetical protein